MLTKLEMLAFRFQYPENAITQISNCTFRINQQNGIVEYNVYDREERYNQLIAAIFDEIENNGYTSKFNKFDAINYMKIWQFDEIYDEYLEGLKEDAYSDTYENSYDWFVNEIGLDMLGEYIKEEILDFDFDKLALDIIKYGNPGEFLSKFDGKEIQMGDRFFAYKMYQI